MIKNIKFLSLFAILLASCNFPSLDNSSFLMPSNFSSRPNGSSGDTQPTSGQSSGTSNMDSSSNLTSSSSSTTISNSENSSGTSNPDSDNKVPFEEIDTLVAQVADAKALGIESTNETQSDPLGRKKSQGDSPQNYVVKVTETYDPQVQVLSDQTVEVTFLRTTETVTNELQTGFDSYVASAPSVNINKITNAPGHVVVENIPGYEFRALKDNVALSDWKSDEGLFTEFLFTKSIVQTMQISAVAEPINIEVIQTTDSIEDRSIEIANVSGYEYRLVSGGVGLSQWTRATTASIVFSYSLDLNNVTVEARSYQASITFSSSEGVAYTIRDNQDLLLSDITEGSIEDVDTSIDTITISNLIQGELYTVEFEASLPDEDLTDIEIEARSIDASITFTAFQDFTYQIKYRDTAIYSDITDNDAFDLNPKVGVIEVKGLIQNQSYDVHYSGYQNIERVTQDEIDGQVDKLFVLYQYTFISFTPLSIDSRPQDSDLVRDYDRVAIYDKTNYFSNATRQSFVINNDTGFIYKIEDITIANLFGGCVTIAGNNSPFDMTTNENGSLVFTSLSNNPDVVVNACIKDRHGYTYINNNLMNRYESTTKTYFYVPNSFYSTFYDVPHNNAPGTGQNFTYWLNSVGEVVRTEPTGLANSGLIYRVMTGESVNATRTIDASDNFEIYVSQYKYQSVYGASRHQQTAMQHMVPKSRVKDGVVFTNFGSNVSGKPNPMVFYPFYQPYNQYNYLVETINDVTTYYSTYVNPNFGQGTPKNYWTMLDYLDEYEIVLVNRDGAVYYYPNYWHHHRESFKSSNQSNILSYNRTVNNVTYYGKHTEAYRGPGIELETLAGTTVNAQGKLQKVTPNGTQTFDLIIEKVDNEWVVIPYLTGSYQATTATTITFQPINR
jgi:hypothetical protein